MEIMYLLVPVSVILVFLIGILFWWSLRSGQFDDMEGPAYRILMDDDKVAAEPPAAAKLNDNGIDGAGGS
jgi:cbb3-type cytochrome oxidase maturation protein